MDLIKDNLKIEYVDIGTLIPAEYNPRQADDKTYNDLKTSITRFGLKDPIIVNAAPSRMNIIIGGHFSVRVAKDLGYTQVPVVYINIPDIEKEKELNLRLNRNLGSWDYDLLANLDEVMLKDVGFDSKELDRIFQKADKDDDDAPAVRASTDIKIGDIFQLGPHRLMCGDATNKGHFEALMREGDTILKASMVFTDPPHNVNYTGGMNESGKNDREGIMNDHMDRAQFYAFLEGACRNIVDFTEGGIYICMSSSELDTLKLAFLAVGGHYQSFIIWVKSHFTISRADYQHLYEPILYGWPAANKGHYFIDSRDIPDVWEDLKGIKTEYDGEYTTIAFQGFKVRIKGKVEGEVVRKKQRQDIWRFDKPSRSEQHPTMKPVAMVKQAILNSSMREGIVLDPFGGSGSTLIACEETKRICRMCEIDPIYCQVIIDRWEAHTSQKAQKVNA